MCELDFKVSLYIWCNALSDNNVSTIRKDQESFQLQPGKQLKGKYKVFTKAPVWDQAHTLSSLPVYAEDQDVY